jgi:hypothetical protein
MTAQEVINEIKPLASDGYKKILLNHGVKEPCLGVEIARHGLTCSAGWRTHTVER